jgi:hypothetical protein
VPTIQPPIIQAVLPVCGARVNGDRNENVTGMPTVLGEAPLGTYVGWNPRWDWHLRRVQLARSAGMSRGL